MNSSPSRHTYPARERRTRPWPALLALLVTLAGLVSVASPAQAAGVEVTFAHRIGDPNVGGMYAWDVTTDDAGNVYLPDQYSGTVRKYDAEGTPLQSFSVTGELHGIAVDASGAVYVGGFGEVRKYSASGDLLDRFEAGAYTVFGLDVGADGFLYAMASGSTSIEARVLKMTLDGDPVSSWGVRTDANGYHYFYGLAADEDGFVYVPDYYQNSVRKFSPAGELVATWTTVGSRALSGPLGVETNARGQVVVTEWNRQTLLVLSPQGELQGEFNGRQAGDRGGLTTAAGVTIDDAGRVYVSDVNAGVVMAYDVAPRFAAFTPEVSGSGRVGDELTVTATTTPTPASWTYAWTVEGSDAVRSDSATFTPTAADRGKTATVTVTARGTDGEPRDRTGTATKAITGKLMNRSAFSLTDSTPSTAPTTGDVLTLAVDESKLPADAEGTVRWGRVVDGCVIGGDASASRAVTDADAGDTICARVAYTASGYEDLTFDLSADRGAIGTFTAPDPTIGARDLAVGHAVTASVDLADAPRGAEVAGWQWGVRDGQDCAAVEGATEATFTPDVAEFDHELCVTVTVSAPHRLAATATATLGTVGEGAFAQSPTVTISGWSTVGQEAEATVDGGDPADGERSYQWNIDGTPVQDAVAATFTPRPLDVGKLLTVTVTSSARGYVDDVTTSAGVEVKPGDLAVKAPTFSTNRPTVGSPVSLPLDLSDAPEGAEGHWQWGAWDAEAAECVAFGGATTDTLTPTADRLGTTLCAMVGVTAPGYDSVSARFVAPNPVVRGALPTMRAVLSSTKPKVGSTLTASLLASGLPRGARTTVAWGQSVAGTACRPSKTATSLRITADTVGRRVCALVTVAAPGYTEWSTVLTTSVVKEKSTVAPSRKVVRGTDAFVVRAQGMEPGQRYRISIRHRMFTGRADSHGRVARSVRYGTGLKSGQRTVIVRGFTGSKVTYLKKFTVTYRGR